jgi:hypothetical protein
MLNNFKMKVKNINFYNTFSFVKYFICVTFIYTLHKAEISSINLVKLHVRLQKYYSPFLRFCLHSPTMATLLTQLKHVAAITVNTELCLLTYFFHYAFYKHNTDATPKEKLKPDF